MRVIHKSSPTNVAYCGIAIDAGSRDENTSEFGIAHFCEHALFKGTIHHSARHIINRMEAVGGDLNAYTTKEETVVYAAFMKEHLDRAVELIYDVVFNSTYPQKELDKEAEVIVEEIESYMDSPAELIFDEFENFLFKKHPLGHDILGCPQQIRTYTTEKLQQFTKRLYKPENTIFFIFGDYNTEQIKKSLSKVTDVQSIETNEKKNPKKNKRNSNIQLPTSFCHILQKEVHQAHVMMGCRAYPSYSNKRVAIYFLNNIIGGPGMNSLLNVALREKRGLVYTVESNLTNYTDTSTFSIYFGCDANDVEKCVRIVKQELNLLATTCMSEKKFKAALKQIKGQIGVACDNFENYALDMAKSFLHYHKFEGVKETFEQLDALTPAILQQVAQELFTDLSILIYQPKNS